MEDKEYYTECVKVIEAAAERYAKKLELGNIDISMDLETELYDRDNR